MIEASREQVFAQVQLIRQRAMQLLAGEPVTAEAELSSLLGPIDLRLGQLARRFHLSQLAIEAIVCLLAVEYDPSLRTLIRAHQREAGRPCLELGTLVDLLGLALERVPELERELAPAVSLGAWTLVERDETTSSSPAVFQKVRLAARVARYLVGDDTLLDAGMTRLESAAADEELPAARAALLDRAWRAAQHGPVVVEIVGKPNTGRRELACVLAHRMGQPLVVLDLRGVDARALAPRLTDLRREARLSDAVPALLHWDVELQEAPQATTDEPTGAPQASTPRQLPAALVRFFETLEGVAVLIAEETEPLVGFHAPSVVTALTRTRWCAEAMTGSSGPSASSTNSSGTVERSSSPWGADSRNSSEGTPASRPT